MLTGELKAIEMVINEFIQSFDIHDEELSSIWGVQNRDGDAPIDEQRNDEDSSEQ
ncbi:hypothetical protein LR69_02927 [Geobacillus sp. BCO2]|nr:hypothetical protein LR69_02927 [Geobacillus sp. BCO2]